MSDPDADRLLHLLRGLAQGDIPSESRKHPGRIWWEGLSEDERAYWCRRAGSDRPGAAWRKYKEVHGLSDSGSRL